MSDLGRYPHWDGGITTYTYDAGKLNSFSGSQPVAPPCSCERDEKKRVFRITAPDGQTTEFHDRAVRFLVVEPDPTTGELEPAVVQGKPKVIYLCREAGL
jgi:hypothetical protein